MEFQEADYDKAIDLADSIYASANAIYNVFQDVDSLMNMLHGTHWDSMGSDDVKRNYILTMKSRFEPFYEDVKAMRNHIYTVTGRNIEADTKASDTVAV